MLGALDTPSPHLAPLGTALILGPPAYLSLVKVKCFGLVAVGTLCSSVTSSSHLSQPSQRLPGEKLAVTTKLGHGDVSDVPRTVTSRRCSRHREIILGPGIPQTRDANAGLQGWPPCPAQGGPVEHSCRPSLSARNSYSQSNSKMYLAAQIPCTLSAPSLPETPSASPWLA